KKWKKNKATEKESALQSHLKPRSRLSIPVFTIYSKISRNFLSRQTSPHICSSKQKTVSNVYGHNIYDWKSLLNNYENGDKFVDFPLQLLIIWLIMFRLLEYFPYGYNETIKSHDCLRHTLNQALNNVKIY
ncbi:CLUMA_CG012630, isoform A, partial [Clunio marinus]